jgi:tripeptide aminopeptidase
VKRATDWIDARFDDQLAEWIRITEMPAPSGQEAARAAYVKAEMEKAGLSASIDASGNMMARRKGSGGGPTVVFAAHMDTVFPLGTNVKVTRKPDGTLHGPGVGRQVSGIALRWSLRRHGKQAGRRRPRPGGKRNTARRNFGRLPTLRQP